MLPSPSISTFSKSCFRKHMAWVDASSLNPTVWTVLIDLSTKGNQYLIHSPVLSGPTRHEEGTEWDPGGEGEGEALCWNWEAWYKDGTLLYGSREYSQFRCEHCKQGYG